MTEPKQDLELAALAETVKRIESRLDAELADSPVEQPPAVQREAAELDADVDELDEPDVADDKTGPEPRDHVATKRSDDVVVRTLVLDQQTWATLTRLADSENVAPGAMLGRLIQRGLFLQQLAERGGQLLVKRGRNVYRLTDARDPFARYDPRRARRWWS
jgi:hypothetical protein